MKKSLLLLMLLLPLLSFAQNDFKLAEQNPKEKPNWVTESNVRDVLMVQANRMPTLKEAENAAMTSLRENIASSIAVKVTGKTDTTKEEEIKDGKSVYSENIQSTTSVEIAEMPAIQGISLSKAQIYWERYYNKKTKESYYDYYILYPLTSQDLAKMIDDYNNTKALDKYPDEWKNFTSHNFIYDIQSERKNADRSDTELVNTLLEVARTNIAKQIQIKVEGNSSVKGKTTYATDIDVNLVLTKSHFNPHSNKMYVMAYINKEDAVRFYKRQIDVVFSAVEKHIAIADDYIETGFIAKAEEEIAKTDNEFKKLEKPIFFLTVFDCPEYELQSVLQRHNELEQTTKRKITDMKYGTDIYVQCAADMFGQNYMNLSKELKAALSNTMECNFVDDKSAADWAITVNANSREYNKVDYGSTSSYFSYVDAEITLEKVMTAQRVYEDMITEKGAHTRDFKEAARDAYKKITPKIINLVTENIK